MTSNAERAAILERALRAGVARDPQAIRALCTDDVRAWAPAVSASSLDELIRELERRDPAFSDAEVEIVALDVGGAYACAEWAVTMTHSGALALAGELEVEPTGLPVTVHGVTVAEFREDRICAIRQYWDELSVLEQLGIVREDE